MTTASQPADPKPDHAEPLGIVLRERARQAVAARHGVPVSRVRGRTPAEMEHHAQRLARAMRAHPAGTRRPDSTPEDHR